MTYCCCTPQSHCRYCRKAGKPFSITKPFFNISDEDFEKFRQKANGHSEVKPVAQCTETDVWNCKYCRKNKACDALNDNRNFASPPQRQPLKLDELWRVFTRSGLSQFHQRDGVVEYKYERCIEEFARAIEAAHKIKVEK